MKNATGAFPAKGLAGDAPFTIFLSGFAMMMASTGGGHILTVDRLPLWGMPIRAERMDSMRKLTGFVIDTNNFEEISDVLDLLRTRAANDAEKLYERLLAREIENAVDLIALNQMPRPDIPLWDAARNELDNRIATSSEAGFLTEYNLTVIAALFVHDGKCYVRIETTNPCYGETFGNAAGHCANVRQLNIEADGLGIVSDPETEREWDRVRMAATGIHPVVPMGPPTRPGSLGKDLKPENMEFMAKPARAEQKARTNLTNVLSNQYGLNRQIPPARLLEYIGDGLELMVESQACTEALNTMREQLMNTLPDIDAELLLFDPSGRKMVADTAQVKETSQPAGAGDNVEEVD